MKQTPHIQPTAPIAKTVLMPGDPLRAKFISENFLENAVQFNAVRGMLGYTGTYKGKQVSVMGSGMGMPSTGIYAYELFNIFDVENIIRIGSCGAYQEENNLYDIIIGMSASTNSNFAHQYNLNGMIAPTCSYKLLDRAVKAAKKLEIGVSIGNILTSDTFYSADTNYAKSWADMGVLAVEMEAAALYLLAAEAKKHALCILTVSDHIFKEEYTTPEERETAFTEMMQIALEVAE